MMNINTNLTSDLDFDHAIFFGSFVMVSIQDKVVGMGLIEKFSEHEVQVSGKNHLRKQSVFTTTEPFDIFYDFK